MDNTKWRDELTFLDSFSSSKDRAEVVLVITRVLLGMIVERKGRGQGTSKRAALLGALGGCSDEELSPCGSHDGVFQRSRRSGRRERVCVETR